MSNTIRTFEEIFDALNPYTFEQKLKLIEAVRNITRNREKEQEKEFEDLWKETVTK